MKYLSMCSFVVLRCVCLFLFTTSVGYLLSRDSLCRAFLICMELSTILAFVTHSIVLFAFPTSFKSNRKRRIIALSCSSAFFVVMVVCLVRVMLFAPCDMYFPLYLLTISFHSKVLSTARVLSHHLQENLHCQLINTSHWNLVAIGALILFNVAALLHFLQLGYQERAMRPYLLDITCIGLITLTLIVILVITPFEITSKGIDFIFRNYIILIITVVDTRLLLKRARESESEHIGGIPLPLPPILNDDDDEVLTMETASLRSFGSQTQSRISQADPKSRRISTPFQRYDRYSYYSPTRLDDIKSNEYPLVEREVVVALN